MNQYCAEIDISLKTLSCRGVPRHKVTLIELTTHLRLADVTAWEPLRRVTWVIGGRDCPSSSPIGCREGGLDVSCQPSTADWSGQNFRSRLSAQSPPPEAKLVDSSDWPRCWGKCTLIGRFKA